MTSFALIFPVLLILVSLVMVVKGLVWITDTLYSIHEREGTYPPTRVLFYVVTGLVGAALLVAGGGLIYALRALVAW